jgi:hypothetical protein
VTARYATRNAVLTYLRVANEPRPMVLIRRYMFVMHRASPGATRTQVWRLCRDGIIERVGLGLYQYKHLTDCNAVKQ